jgi:hypothetical protein
MRREDEEGAAKDETTGDFVATHTLPSSWAHQHAYLSSVNGSKRKGTMDVSASGGATPLLWFVKARSAAQ